MELLQVKTIALDFTFLHTLKANNRSLKTFLDGLTLDTILKLSLLKNFSSAVWINKVSKLLVKLVKFCRPNFDASINLKFFFFLGLSGHLYQNQHQLLPLKIFYLIQ